MQFLYQTNIYGEIVLWIVSDSVLPIIINITSLVIMTEQLLFDVKQVNLPFTLAMIKPDLVLDTQKLAEIIKLIQSKFIIKSMIQRQLYKEEAMNLFYKHSNKPYFDDLIQYILSGQCCVMILSSEEGDPIEKWKNIIGLSDPEAAKKTNPESLRAKYGKTLIKNQFHGSDNIIEANKERKIFQFKIPQRPPQYIEDPQKITLKSIEQFLHPPNLQHTCMTQRMDLMALYGPIVNWHSIEQCFCLNCIPIVREVAQRLKNQRPASEKFKPLKVLKENSIRQIYDELCKKCQNHCSSYTHLLGGREMQHILTDNQIKELFYQLNKKEILEMLTIEKGSTAKVMIQKITIQEPKQINYNMDFFILLLKQLQTDYYDRYQFNQLQNLILEDRRIRITYWISQLTGKSIDRFPSVTTLDSTLTKEQLSDPKSPFFTINRNLPLPLLIKPQKIKNVTLLFPPSIVDKEKLHRIQENLVTEKLLHRNLTKVTYVGSKNKGIKEAVTLLRPYNQGRHGDWNNYANLKGNSVKGEVGGKNMAEHLSQ